MKPEFNRERAFVWAAYGDALGFITELRDSASLRRVIGKDRVSALVPWTRRVGGLYGADVQMPLGAYSDDTQLRIAVSRSIHSNGFFDVENFSKIELPIWLSYALGAGRASKDAAQSLSKSSTAWFSNFYESNARRGNYVTAGGNGAAMRIQPHVYSCRDLEDWDSLFLDVFRNAICTHGHPRAIIGALFHALVLARAIKRSNAVGPEDWEEITSYLSSKADLIRSDSAITTFWLPTWNRLSGQPFEIGYQDACNELKQSLSVAPVNSVISGNDNNATPELTKYLKNIGGFDRATLGSGIVASVVAAVVSWIYRDSDCADIALVLANLSGSDTDTNASMTLSISGGVAKNDPPHNPQDIEFLRKIGRRLVLISKNERVEDYIIPDASNWKAPQAIQDMVAEQDGATVVQGFGPVKTSSELYRSKSSNGGTWQWVGTSDGQSLLVRRREELRKIRKDELLVFKKDYRQSAQRSWNTKKDVLFAPQSVAANARQLELSGISTKSADIVSANSNKIYGTDENRSNLSDFVESEAQRVIKSGFSALVLGHALLNILDKSQSVELAVAFVHLIAKARANRRRR